MSLRRALVPLIAAQVCLHACMSGTRLAAPLTALKEGRGAAAVGLLLALFAVAPIVLSLRAGRYADRHGYHLPVRVGVAMSLAGALTAVVSQHYLALCAAAVLTGGGTCFALVAIQRYAGRLTHDATELKQVFSWLAIGPAASNFIGPFVAGLLIDTAGVRWAFAFMAGLPLLTAWWARYVPPQPLDPGASTLLGPGASKRRSVWDLMHIVPLRRLLVVNWVLSACWDLHTFVVPVLGHERGLSATAIGSILGAFSIAAVVVRVLIPVLAHRLKEWQVLMGAMLGTASMFALYPLAPSALLMGVCSVGLGLALGSVQPMVMSALHQVTPPERQGEALGLRMMVINASSSVMPLLFGGVGALAGAASLFWAASAFAGGGSALARRLERDLGELPQRQSSA